MIIRQHLVPTATARKVTSGTGNTRRKICIHETDNTSKGSRADNHARLQARGNSRQASWHWQVDDKEAVQSFTHDWRCWAAGKAKGNNEAIHIEICVNSDGDYHKAVQNAAKLVAKIMKDENLSLNDIVQHNDYSGKNCPRIMRSASVVTWFEFKKMVEKELKGGLTVSEAKKLQSQINELDRTIKALQSTVDNKATARSDALVSDWAKPFYDWAVENGLTDGTNPRGALTREQALIMFNRLYDKIMNDVK